MPGGKIPGTGRGYRGSARGPGFRIIPEESIRLSEITEDSEYFEEAKRLAEGIRKIVRMLEDMGF